MKAKILFIVVILFVARPSSMLGQSWTTVWSNGGSGQIGTWNLQNSDIISPVYGNGILLTNASSGWAQLRAYSAQQWGLAYNNNGSGEISSWALHSQDRFYKYDFSDVLAVNHETHYAAMISFTGGSANVIWNNGGNNQFGGWSLTSDDFHVVGNFKTGLNEEILSINGTTGWAMLQYYSAGAFNQYWNNSGSDNIAGWSLGPNDSYHATDVDGDGIDELVCFNRTGGWATILKYTHGSGWSAIWSNGGGGSVSWWNLGSYDRYLSGRFDPIAKDQVFLANSSSGYAGLLGFGSSSWFSMWGNGGGGSFNGWNLSSTTDRYFPIVYQSDSIHKLLLVNTSSGYAALMAYVPPTFSVSIIGPSQVYHPEKNQPVNQYTWEGYVQGAYYPLSNGIWKKNGNQVGTGGSYSESFSYNGASGGSYQFTLRYDVNDAAGRTTYATTVVTAYNSGGGPAEMAKGLLAELILPPSEFGIMQNYPNPFNPETEVRFNIPEPSSVNILVMDVLGRRIAVLNEGSMSQGFHRVTWNGKDQNGIAMSSGIYFYSIDAVGESGTRFTKVMKMILMK